MEVRIRYSAASTWFTLCCGITPMPSTSNYRPGEL